MSMTWSSRMADTGVGGVATAAMFVVSWKSGVECVFVGRGAKPKRDRNVGVDGWGVTGRCWVLMVGLVRKAGVP